MSIINIYVHICKDTKNIFSHNKMAPCHENGWTLRTPLTFPGSTQPRGFHSAFLQSVLLTPPTYIWGGLSQRLMQPQIKHWVKQPLVYSLSSSFAGFLSVMVVMGHHSILDNTLYVSTCCVMFFGSFFPICVHYITVMGAARNLCRKCCCLNPVDIHAFDENNPRL